MYKKTPRDFGDLRCAFFNDYILTVSVNHDGGGSKTSKGLHFNILQRKSYSYEVLSDISHLTQTRGISLFLRTLLNAGINPKEYISALENIPDYTGELIKFKFLERDDDDVFTILQAPHAYFRRVCLDLESPNEIRDILNREEKLRRKYRLSSMDGLESFIDVGLKETKTLPEITRPVVVIKIGGSSLDAEFDDWENKVVSMIVPCIEKLLNKYCLICVPGGGPAWDPRKRWNVKYNMPTQLFRELSKETLKCNAIELSEALGEKAVFISPENFDKVDDELLYKNIVVMSTCPEQIIKEFSFEPEYSDTQTLAIAEMYGAKLCIFLKRTSGIKRWDPRLSLQGIKRLLGQNISENARKQLRSIHELLIQNVPNEQFHYINATTMINGPPEIYTIGEDAQGNHLIELPALRFFLEKTKKLEKIVVSHIKKPELIEDIIKNTNQKAGYSVIVKK